MHRRNATGYRGGLRQTAFIATVGALSVWHTGDAVAAVVDTDFTITLDGSDMFFRPVMPTPYNGVYFAPNISAGGTLFAYGVRPFTPTIGGNYSITVISSSFNDPIIYVYTGAFNPALPLANIYAGNDDRTGSLWSLIPSLALAATTPYYLVGTSYLAGVTGTFGFRVSGPGSVAVGADPAAPVIDTSQPFFIETDAAAQASPMVFAGGTLRPTGSAAFAQPVEVQATNGVVNPNGGTTLFSGNLSGPGTLALNGSGTLSLTGTNTHAGTSIANGNLSIGSAAALGSGPLAIGNGSLSPAGSVTLNNAIQILHAQSTVNTGANVTTLAGNLAGAGTLNKTGTGTLVLAGTNTHAGTSISQGDLAINSASALGSGTLAIDNASLSPTTSMTLSNAVQVLHAQSTVNTGVNSVTLAGNVSGAGVLNKAGSGLLLLTGDNSHASTRIDGGVLGIFSDAALGAGPLTLVDATLRAYGDIESTSRAIMLQGTAATIDTQGHQLAIGGSISGGATTLIKTGSGVLALTGVNSHAATTVSAGTLAINSDAALGAGPLQVGAATVLALADYDTAREIKLTDPAATFDSGLHSVTLSGTLAGAGTLNKTGSGTLTLLGTNTHAGTAVHSGTLAIDSDVALGAADTMVTLGDATLRTLASFVIDHDLVIDDATSATIDTHAGDIGIGGNISGAGVVRKVGAGTLVLSGANSQLLTIVAQGGVTVASAGAAGAPGADIDIHADSTFTAQADMTLSQNLHFVGAGAAIDTGGNRVTLLGSADGTFCLTKRGLGSLDLRADSSNAIGACVEQGMFAVNAQFAGNIFVWPAATLGGDGHIIGDVVVEGTLSPGNSPGVMTVSGSVTQMPGSTFVAEIDGPVTETGAGSYDRLVLLGTNSLYTADGTLLPVLRDIPGPANNNFTPAIGDVFEIVTAEGGVAGTYAAVQQPVGLPPNSRFDVLYLDGAIRLAVTPATLSDFAATLTSDNAVRLGEAFDSVRPGAGSAEIGASGALFAGLVGLDEAGVALALQQAAGEVHADSMAATRDTNRQVRTLVARRMAPNAPIYGDTTFAAASADGAVDGRAFWFDSSGRYASVDADRDADTYRVRSGSAVVGMEARLSEASKVGFALGFAKTTVDAGRLGDGDTDSFHLLAYSSTDWQHMFVNVVGGAAFDDYKVQRHVNLSTGTRALQADTRGYTFALDVEVGRRFTFGRAEIEPSAGLRLDRVERSAVSEDGDAAVALGFDDESLSGAQFRVGTRASSILQFNRVEIIPRVEAFFVRDFGSGRRAALAPQLHGATWTTLAPDGGRNALQFGVGATASTSDRIDIYVDYQAEIRKSARSHTVMAGMRMRW